jgi:hypothetical protein
MASNAQISEVIKRLKRGQQREAMDYMYDNLDGSDLTEVSQIGTRITALADSVSNKKSREREQRRRKIGGSRGGEEYVGV